jgi:serine/threonine-protein kinase
LAAWDDIQEELARLLRSRVFARCARLQRFLRYTVERALAGDAVCLKEYTLAVEVFDRPHNYDPRVDSVVRVEARRLRRKLSAYYETDGRRDRVRITYPRGSYVPVFEPGQPPGSRERLSVAVLPFLNLTPDAALEYFCDGLTEELINALTARDAWNVVARTSVFQFKGVSADVRKVGRKLAVQTVIEGSVRQDGSRLRITAQAIDTGTGYHLWSGTFDRNPENRLRTQEEVGADIARALCSKLLAEPVLTSA